MKFSPPEHLKRLSKPPVLTREQAEQVLELARDLNSWDKPNAEEVAEALLKSVLKDLLKYEAFRSLRIARTVNTVFVELDQAGPLSALTVGRYRQRDLIVGTLNQVAATVKPAFWYEVGKATFRALYKIWLQDEVQVKDRIGYPDTI